MSVEAGLYSILSSSTTLSVLVSDRIFPKTRRNCNTFPALVYHRISTNPVSSHDAAEGLARIRFQIDCIGSSFASAIEVAAAVRGVLSGYRGYVGGGWLSALRENERDSFENETGLHVVQQDYFIYFQED